MSYIKATHLLPIDLLAKIQEYIDGEYIYIPKIDENKLQWGSNTNTRSELKIRNKKIYNDYLNGLTSDSLSKKYFLSIKSIQRIVRQQKQINNV